MYSSKTPIDQVNSTKRQIRTDAKNSLQLEGADREAPSGVWGPARPCGGSAGGPLPSFRGLCC